MTRLRVRAAVAGIAALGLVMTACTSDDPQPAPAVDATDDEATDDPATDDAADDVGTGTEDDTDGAADEDLGDEYDGMLATIDTIFGPVEIPRPANREVRVVALGWSDAEIALALGTTPVAVYDWMGFGEQQHGVGEWAAELVGDQPPVVMPNDGGTFDYELIESLEPDVILNVRSEVDEDVFNRLTEIAPTVYPVEDSASYATSMRDHTLMVGAALGLLDQANSLVAEAEFRIAEARNQHPEFEGLTAVSASKFGDEYGVNLPGDVRWYLLEELGFVLPEPVTTLDDPAGYYAPVSADETDVLEADVAVFAPIGLGVDELASDPVISSLDVVGDGRAVMLDPDDPVTQAFHAGSVLSIPIALEGLVPALAEAAQHAGG